eukprot:scaffold22968_cov28-Prasinocladus_malaysianus.AAC.1
MSQDPEPETPEGNQTAGPSLDANSTDPGVQYLTAAEPAEAQTHEVQNGTAVTVEGLSPPQHAASVQNGTQVPNQTQIGQEAALQSENGTGCPGSNCTA